MADELKGRAEMLRREAATMRAALDAVVTMDAEGRIVAFNPAAEALFGYSSKEAVGALVADLLVPASLRWAHREGVSRVRCGGPVHLLGKRQELVAMRAGGETFPIELALARIQDDPLLFTAFIRERSELSASELALRTSERRLRSILDNTPSAVSVKGADYRYQLVNRAFEERFSLERDSIVGRLDDEILPPSMLALERQGDDLVLRAGESVEQEEVLSRDGEDRVYLTLKFPLRDEDGAISAVCAMFHDITDRKRHEREMQERLEWTTRIHSAVAQRRLLLHAQPIVNLASGEVEQAELLVRMLDATDSSNVLLPAEFLPAAERFGLTAVIDLWVVARAVELANRGHRVEINLSGPTISDPAEIAAIERLVIHSGAPPENIIFEITETAVAENLDAARRFAERLRKLGCSFALDDFGVGFGTFTYLKHLPVDYLKIDIDFVNDLADDETNRQVVQAIVGVARDYGLKTIAEGVEDLATLELLELMGVNYAQGFWIGRPKPIDELWPHITDQPGKR
jgi:PAS domain S-box-containing protein